jgi:peptidyl-tRNA hydrolase, PTH1 family
MQPETAMELLFESHPLQSGMIMIVGLGNPGETYQYTRHNIGFLVIDKLAARYGIRIHSGTDCSFGTGIIDGRTVSLVKPLTYMNLSGGPILRLASHFGVDLKTLLVVYDDMDLVFGKVKIKQKGGDGGHKGIRSIIDAFDNDGFIRLRIGIGRPRVGTDAIQHVLSPFDTEEANQLEDILTNASDAAVLILQRGVSEGMKCFNGKGVLKSC